MIKITLLLLVSLYLIPVFAVDICTRLNTNNGTSAFKILDSDNKLLFTVDSSGKIGIGTGSPQSILHVLNPSAEVFAANTLRSSLLALTNTSLTNNTFGRLSFNTNDNSGMTAAGAGICTIFSSHTTSQVSADLAIQTRNAGAVMETARFTSSGNLGIGIVSPGAKLQISAGDSSLALYGPNTSGGKLYVGAGGNQGVASTAQVLSTNGNLHLDSAPACGLYLNYLNPTNTYIHYNGGNVAVGGATTGYKLTVNGEVYANGGWLRTSEGAGFYNDSYGGGWYMSDTTWIRAYNPKYVWIDQVLGCNAGLTVGYSGGAPASWGGAIFAGPVGIGMQNNAGYTLQVAGYIYSPYGGHSDVRWKKNITPLTGSLGKICKLEGVTYEWKKEENQTKGFETGTRVGLIAQEVEKIIPELVTTDKDGYKGLYYEKLVPLLIEAIKEQRKKIESLKVELKRQNEIQDQLAAK
ncbi:MAG: tail fiber domain-containing protein [Candidatus Wallbacteria bacterium]|nr:tail fiber domain-containing protein [Candidatus Wallbacteria bacterium]